MWSRSVAVVASVVATSAAAGAQPPGTVPPTAEASTQAPPSRAMFALGAGVRSAPELLCWSLHAGVRVVGPLFVTAGYVDGWMIGGDGASVDGRMYLLGLEVRPHLIWHVYGLATLEAGSGRNQHNYSTEFDGPTTSSVVAESKLGIEVGKYVYGRLLAGGLFRRSEDSEFEAGDDYGVSIALQVGVRAL